MAVKRLPVETWQAILRYSIAVPVFFDIDPIETSGLEEYAKCYHNRSLYWRSERHRNILRRVCSAWNIYLCRFNHRFIFTRDIFDGTVPSSFLRQAIRLDEEWGTSVEQEKIFIEIFSEVPGDWSLEILYCATISIRNLILQSGKVDRLKGLAYVEDVDPETIDGSALTYCDINGIWFEDFYARGISLSQLTSLNILTDSLAPLLLCRFPSLKHFKFTVLPGIKRPRDFVKLLQVTGKNLLTLIDMSGHPVDFIPEETWALCPRLKTIQTRFSWPANAQIPSTLRSLRLSEDHIMSEEFTNINENHRILPDIAGIASVTFTFSWREALFKYNASLDLVLHSLDRGINIYDIAGMKFQDFVIRLLSNRKHYNVAFMYYWIRPYVNF